MGNTRTKIQINSTYMFLGVLLNFSNQTLLQQIITSLSFLSNYCHYRNPYAINGATNYFTQEVIEWINTWFEKR